MLRRSIVALAFVLGACGTADAVDTDDSVPPTALATVPGVGNLPDTIPVPTLDESEEPDTEPVVSVVVTRPVDDSGVVVESVAERVNGNRLLVIGDSILASTATRYGKELCEALNPIGWSVEVDAEPGRFVSFGNEVAEARLDVDDEDFDAVVIHLGSNYGRDKDEYFEQLSELLYRAAPRPTLLLTVTEYRPQWSEVNDVIDELAGLYDNVTIVDWEKIARAPGVLSRDGLHPGNQGEAVLVEQIAVALGELETDDGECLRSPFTDDSAIGQGSSSSGGSSTGGSSTSGSSSSGSSSSGSSSGGSSTSGSSSSGSSSGGSSTSGSSSGGSTSGTTGGTTTGGTTTGGDATSGGTTTGGDATSGGTTTGGDATSGGTTTGGDATSGGTTTGGDATSGGTTTGGDATSGGTTTGGSTGTTGGSTTGGSTTGGSTTGGSTTGGSTTGGDATTGGTTIGTTSGGTDSGGGEG